MHALLSHSSALKCCTPPLLACTLMHTQHVLHSTHACMHTLNTLLSPSLNTHAHTRPQQQHSMHTCIGFLKTSCRLKLPPHFPQHVAPCAAARVAGTLLRMGLPLALIDEQGLRCNTTGRVLLTTCVGPPLPACHAVRKHPKLAARTIVLFGSHLLNFNPIT